MKTSESIKECLKEMLIDLGTDNLEYLSGIADYNYANSKEEYINNIIGYINDEVVENQGYQWEDIFNEYKKINDEILEVEKSLDTIYLFTHFILTEVMDGTEVRPTLENMFKAYKN